MLISVGKLTEADTLINVDSTSQLLYSIVLFGTADCGHC
jgi:hypothetical protein